MFECFGMFNVIVIYYLVQPLLRQILCVLTIFMDMFMLVVHDVMLIMTFSSGSRRKPEAPDSLFLFVITTWHMMVMD